MLPDRHAAAAQPLHHPDVDAVLAEHLEGVLARAAVSLFCTKQVWKSTASPPGSGLDPAARLGPGVEGAGGEVGQRGVPVDAQRPSP